MTTTSMSDNASTTTPITNQSAASPTSMDGEIASSPKTSDLSPKQEIAISITVAGAVLIIALLVWLLYRRRRGARYTEILHMRQRPSSTVVLSPTPSRPTFLGLPIMKESRYSVHSSRYAASVKFPDELRRKASQVSNVMARFHTQHSNNQDTWKTSHNFHAPGPTLPHKEMSVNDRTDGQTFLLPATPTSARFKHAREKPPRLPAMVLAKGSRERPASKSTRRDAEFASKNTDAADSPATISHPPATHDRFCWSNVSVPSTPTRSEYSSRFSPRSVRSAPRFKTVVSWVRGQHERLQDEEAMRPMPQNLEMESRPGMAKLRNQAWKPTLSPERTNVQSARRGLMGERR